MVRNSERFIVAFNRIEKILKQMVAKKDLGFSRLVKILSKRNAVLNRYCDDLLEFAQLRNAIVHNRVETEYTIAEPHLSIVNQIEMIEKEISKPKLVIPMFARHVIVFQENDSLLKLIRIMKEEDISKFPIYHGKRFTGTLTEKGLAHWLAQSINSHTTISLNTNIKEVMRCQENTTKFISKQTTIYEAQEIFRRQIGKGKRLDVLLITEHGNPNEKLLGIITPRDIIDTSYSENGVFTGRF